MNQRPLRGAALGLCTAAFWGCAPAPVAHQTEPIITAALGLDAPLVFRTQAGPLDEPDALPGTLTLADAVRLAATTDPSLQAALARVRMALADAEQARLLPNPVLNFIFKFPEGGGTPSIEAELSADIVSIVQRPRKASAADSRLRVASAEAVVTALDVVAETQERYAVVQALDELMPVLEQRRLLLSKLQQLSRDRLEAGEGTRSDVTTLDGQRIELEVEIAEKRREQRDERLRLSRLIGQPSGEATWSVERWQSPRTVDSSEEAAIEAAIANRPEIRAIMWELAALGDDLGLVTFFDGASAGIKAERDDGWRLGPSVSTPIPVFDTGQARRAKVTAQQIEVRHKLTLARRQVVEDVRRAYQSFGATKANLERVRAELVPLQEQRRDQADEAYRAGQTDVTALFLAEQDLQASLIKCVELEQAATISLVHLERAIGGGAIAASMQPPTPGTRSSPEPGRTTAASAAFHSSDNPK